MQVVVVSSKTRINGNRWFREVRNRSAENYRIRKKMSHRFKFVISASGQPAGREQRRNPKIRLVRIREFHSHAWASRDGTRERMAPCQSDVEIVNSASLLWLSYPSSLIYVEATMFGSLRKQLCGCCDKLSWKLSDLNLFANRKSVQFFGYLIPLKGIHIFT